MTVTIAHIRSHGVRQLLVYCRGRCEGDWPCHHEGTLPIERFSLTATLAEIEHNTAKGIPKIGIGDRCYFRNTIVDKNCRIGNDVRINGGSHLANSDHSLYAVKDGIVVLKKGAVLTDGFVI